MPELRAVVIGAGRMAGTIDDEMHDYPGFVLPYSHLAGYREVPEVEVVAIADVDEGKAKTLQARYDVPRVYGDWQEMLLTEKPDLVSITTPGTLHAEIAVFAAEHGARGIYMEKAFACSLKEADAVVAAVERNGVKFNMGTLRRWSSGTLAVKEMIASGELGNVEAVISYSVGSLLHSASHFIDLVSFFADDAPVEWVEGTLLGDFDVAAERWEDDMNAVGTIRFANGVWGHLMSTSLWAQFEIVCSGGVLRTVDDCQEWTVVKQVPDGRKFRWEPVLFPAYEEASSTVTLINDLVQAVLTGGETKQGVRGAAQSAEIAFGIVESHRQGGKRVEVPVPNRGFWMFTH